MLATHVSLPAHLHEWSNRHSIPSNLPRDTTPLWSHPTHTSHPTFHSHVTIPFTKSPCIFHPEGGWIFLTREGREINETDLKLRGFLLPSRLISSLSLEVSLCFGWKRREMKNYELCKLAAGMYCESDQASLWRDCDAKVRRTNFLVARHVRCLLCRTCQSLTSWRVAGVKLGHTVSVRERCVKGKPLVQKL